jgi:hypothetical protein
MQEIIYDDYIIYSTGIQKLPTSWVFSNFLDAECPVAHHTTWSPLHIFM